MIIPHPANRKNLMDMNFKRPETLAEVSQWSRSEEEFSFHLRDFLDEFYSNPNAARLVDEPFFLEKRFSDNGLADAYLAGIADYLSRTYGFTAPLWTRSPSRYLKEPWFSMKTHGGKMFVLIDSPASFRERNIFISADALVRV